MASIILIKKSSLQKVICSLWSDAAAERGAGLFGRAPLHTSSRRFSIRSSSRVGPDGSSLPQRSSMPVTVRPSWTSLTSYHNQVSETRGLGTARCQVLEREKGGVDTRPSLVSPPVPDPTCLTTPRRHMTGLRPDCMPIKVVLDPFHCSQLKRGPWGPGRYGFCAGRSRQVQPSMLRPFHRL